MAYKLEGTGVNKETAVMEARAFVSSLSEEEAAKLIALVGNDAVMTHIAASLKKRTEASSSLSAAKAVPETKKTQETGVQPVYRERPVQPVQPKQPIQNQEFPIAPKAQQRIQNENPQRGHTPGVTVLPAAGRQERPAMRQVVDPDRKIVSEARRPNAPAENVQSRQERAQANPVMRDSGPERPMRTAPERAPQPQKTRPEQQRPQSPVQRTANQINAQNRNKPRKEDVKDDKRIIYRPDPNADYRKFYIILACTSPIWIFLLLLGVLAFLFVLGALCVSIACLILALVGGVAAGTVLSLVGIVYGITQLFQYAPIGLYEIGLGLMIGGITMLAGIVVYNVAVRLLPFLIKKIASLLVYSMHKCVELYFYVKGACADL